MADKDNPVTKVDLVNGFRGLGLGEGHHVGVHSSLSAFGYVEGGAETVVDALLETVGASGTVVMPAYSNNRENVEKTEEDVALGVSWKYRVLRYDPQNDSTWTGKITDVFWRRPDAARGPHETHSLAAIGGKAEELSQSWHHLLEAEGWILLLGITLSNCSSMHLSERGIEIPERILERTRAPKELRERYHSENIHFGFGPYPDFGLMEKPCRDAGVMKWRQIGDATVKLFRLQELIKLYAEHLRKDPDRFYQGKR